MKLENFATIRTEAFSVLVKTPVASTTYAAPPSAHGILLGSFSEKTVILQSVEIRRKKDNQRRSLYLTKALIVLHF